MRNFQKIIEGLDVLPLMHAVIRHPELWNENTFRTKYTGTPHREVDDIWIRYSKPESVADPENPGAALEDTNPVWYPASVYLPEYKLLAQMVMARVSAYELDRVLVTRVKPGGRIYPHADNGGAYVNQGDISRYHVVLRGLPGSIFRADTEQVHMLTGEVWWFNAWAEHEVFNNSEDDRVHLILDVRHFP